MKRLILILIAVLSVAALGAKLPIVEPYTYNGIPTAYDSVRRIVYNFNATTVLSNLVTADGDSIYREELTVDSCGTYKVNLTFYGNGQRIMVAKDIVSNCYGKGLGNPVTVGTNNDKTGYGLASTQTFNMTGNITGNLSGSVGSVTTKTGYSLAASQAFNNTGTWTGNLTGSVGSVTTVSDKTGYSLAGTQVFNNTGTWAGNITGSLSGSVGSVTGAVGSVTGAVGSVTGAVGSVTGNVGGNVVGSVASVTGAVGSVTGNVGGNVVGSVGTVNALANDVITSASIANGALVLAEFADDYLHEVAVRADSGVTISLTAADIDSIVAGVLAGGVAIDTAAFRANLEATPMIVGTNNDKTDYQLATDAITAAVIAASGAHEIALASDSGGVVAVDYNIIASTAYDYFTAGNREDPFKGGAGAGPDTTLIYVLSAVDSTPIVGASVSYFVGATKLATNTDSTGLVVFGATAGTYTTIAEAKPRYMSTVSVTAGTTDTIYMTQPTIPDPVDTNLTGAYGYIYDLNGDPVLGAIVSVRNQGRDLRVGNTIISHYDVYDTTDAAGFWSMNLYPTATLGDTLTYRYTFTLFKAAQQIVRKQNIVVPDTSSWQFDF